MWNFGHCVSFRPCECLFLDLPMWLFGPEAVPCQWHPPPRIRRIYRNSLETIKSISMTQIIEELPRPNNHDVFILSSTYSLGSSFHNIWIRNCAFLMHANGCYGLLINNNTWSHCLARGPERNPQTIWICGACKLSADRLVLFSLLIIM